MTKRVPKPSKAAGVAPADYAPLLAEIKARVRAAQLRAATSVARELNQLYWEIGSAIARAQESHGYGKQVVERLAADVQAEFPGIAGFSPQNVWFMRTFYLAWTGSAADSLTGVREFGAADSLTGVRESRAAKVQPAVGRLPTKKLSQPVTESVIASTPILQRAVAESPATPPEPVASLPWGGDARLRQRQRRVAIPAWGNAPGIRDTKSYERQRRDSSRSRKRTLNHGGMMMGRAFSPFAVCNTLPGALPQAGMSRAFGPII